MELGEYSCYVVLSRLPDVHYITYQLWREFERVTMNQNMRC